jgi:hypothetical protein
MIGTSERTLERMISKGGDPNRTAKDSRSKADGRVRRRPGRYAGGRGRAAPETNSHAGALVPRAATPQAVLPALLSTIIPQAEFCFRQVLTVEEAAGYTGFSETFLRRM